jgi:Hemerythrin HHE cation binding domain
MESNLELSTNAQSLLDILAATGRAVRLTGSTGGLADVASEWTRHVEEAEEHLFPRLVARGPAADGPVGFCLAEHAALSARLGELAATRPTPEWFREAEMLIGRLIQHVFLEARALQPLVERSATVGCLDDGGEVRVDGREER